MRRWGLGTNSLYKTANYWLEEAPWYIFLIEEVNFLFDWLACKVIFHGKLWGWYYVHIFSPIFYWCNDEKQYWTVKTTWEILQKRHPLEMEKRAKLDK